MKREGMDGTNTGLFNSGYCNSGDNNSGNNNTGNNNTGYRNSGDWNSCRYSAGVFCNEDDRNIRIFNKPSGISLREWRDSRFYQAIKSVPFMLTEGTETKYSYKEACIVWWNKLEEKDQATIQEIPNFDAKIFENITGIKVNQSK